MLNDGIVAEYAEAMLDGAKFPPVIVFRDGAVHWLADGYHRLEAAEEAGKKSIAAEIRDGTKRDATLYACGANRDHGLRRSRADVRRAITTLVQDAEWGQMANRMIAEKVGCSPTTVGTVRDQLSNLDSSSTDTDPPDQVDQLRDFRSSDDEAPGIPSVNSLAEAEAGLNAAFNRDTAPPPPPAKRIGRDGKARAMPKPKPAPTPAPKPAPAVNGARLAMQAAHGVAAALVALQPLENDLLPEDGRMVIANLRASLVRLEERFGLAGMEVKGHA